MLLTIPACSTGRSCFDNVWFCAIAVSVDGLHEDMEQGIVMTIRAIIGMAPA